MEPKDFGKFLKSKREEAKLTMRKLDNLSGVSHSYISQIERGERGIPSPDILKKLATPLNIRYSELMHQAGHIDLARGAKLQEIHEDFEGVVGEENLNAAIFEIIQAVEKRASLFEGNIALGNINRVFSKVIQISDVNDFSKLREITESLPIELKYSLYAELLPWSQSFFKPEILFLLKSDDVTYNGHRLTDPDRQQILDMLKVLFPDYAPND